MYEPAASPAPEARTESETPAPAVDEPPPIEPKAETEKPTEAEAKPPTETKPEKKVETRPADNGPDDDKPSGRLLPWEPPTPAPGPTEQETPDKD